MPVLRHATPAGEAVEPVPASRDRVPDYLISLNHEVFEMADGRTYRIIGTDAKDVAREADVMRAWLEVRASR